jgi:CheY-like chemotaxis protein
VNDFGRRELLVTLKKIELFRGLSPSQVQKILSLCEPRHYQTGEIVCKNKVLSDEMYVLVDGSLSVVTDDGVEVAKLEPVTTVGEMGLITRHVRSATVKAKQDCFVLAIRKGPFELAMRRDPPMQLKVYEHIINMLSGKIVNDNIRTRDHLIQLVRKEKDLNLYRNKAAITLDLLLQQGGISRFEAEKFIDEKLKEVSLRVLVVDDEADIRTFIKRVLAPLVVVEAANGNEALLLVQEERPDLVITDIRMPDMDGLLLLTQLRKNFPDLPVLGLSGYATEDELSRYQFDAFALKPIEPDVFRDMVQDIIRT